ncbi:class I SAM-dependent methyltransferase [Actinopolymorpha sp. B9G3]|uniref:class I SAM-dependent DNA methyltransferase n=1 Tax=Actinopolymorpha sp. B9G3 TaxID=3158970 RepID=UPI0032D93DE0
MVMDSSAEQRERWDRIAADWSPDEAVETAATAPMIDFLAELAGDGPALEFAIGTGRIGVPLARRGVPVAGIDVSPAMVEVLHSAMPAAELPVTVGSMATADAPGRDYQLVFLIANAITCLLHQDEQIACFQNAARHLRPGGYFVIQVWVPQLRQLPPGQTVVPATATDTQLIFDSYDLVTQRLLCHHYALENGVVVSPGTSHHRYVWPSEMDVMAKLAGLDLVNRYAGWDQAEFTGDSNSSISIWQKPNRS